MKRAVSVMLIVAFIIVCTPSCFAFEGSEFSRTNTFVFPHFLEAIEDEAFAGTAVEKVVFHNNLIYLGNKIFADSLYLKNVYLPASLVSIGNNVFSGNASINIHGEKGSYVEQWAKNHQFQFTPSNVWNLSNIHEKKLSVPRMLIRFSVKEVYSEQINNLHGRTEDEGKTMRPQDRPELMVINYKFP